MSQGWALRKIRPHQAFNPNQVTFLRNLFDEGMRSGRKCTAKDASVAMRNARTDEDTLRFPAAEYLTETQIRALFSRWSAQVQNNRDKRSPTNEPTEDEENPAEDIYVDIDDYEDNFPDATHENSAYDIIMSVVEEMGDELRNTCS